MNTRNLAIGSSLLLLVGCTQDRYAGEGYGTYGTPGSSGYGGNQVISVPNSGSANSAPEYTSGAESDADRALVSRIQQQLNSGSLGFSPNVDVTAQNGVVQVTGTVPSEAARQNIDNIVRNTSGVTSVEDRMQVATSGTVYNQYPPPPTSYGATAPIYSGNGQVTTATGDIFNLHVQGLNETDRGLAQRVLEGLRTDTTLAAMLPSVNINIVNGRVVLQGTVQNERQRRAIGEAVARAAGTQNVDNELVISR